MTEGKNRIMIFGPNADGIYVVVKTAKVGQCPSGYRESGSS